MTCEICSDPCRRGKRTCGTALCQSKLLAREKMASAKPIVDLILQNVDDFYTDKIAYGEFSANQLKLWQQAEEKHVSTEVTNSLNALRDTAFMGKD